MTNQITIQGGLTRDATLRYTQSGQPVLNLDIGDSRRRKVGDEWVDARGPLYYQATIWGRLAEMWAETGLLVKGAKVDVTGELTVREYEYEGRDRYALQLRVDQIGVREPRQQQQSSGGGFGQSQGLDQIQAQQQDPWSGTPGYTTGGNDAGSPPF